MGAESKSEKEHRFCPYCDEEIAKTLFPYCQACKITIFYCPQCQKPISRENKVCPNCGAEIKG
ncbi:zinc ribbon domain-containing protein [Chloroflexota bacterium]